MEIKDKNKSYIANPGELIKIVIKKIEKNLKPKERREEASRIKRIKYGKFKNSDLKYLINGLDFIQMALNITIDQVINYLKVDENLTEKKATNAVLLNIAKSNISNFLSSYAHSKYLEYDTERNISNLENLYEIVQNSRDGIITKKQRRIEKDENENEIEIESEVSMSEEEIARILNNYTNELYKLQDEKFSKYLGIGLNVVSLFGQIYISTKNKEESNIKEIGIGALVNLGTFAGKKIISEGYYEKIYRENKEVENLRDELIRHEPVNDEDEFTQLNEIKKSIYKSNCIKSDMNFKLNIINATEIIILSLITSKITLQKVKGNKDIDSKTLAQIMMSYNEKKRVIQNLLSNIKDLYSIQKDNQKLQESEKEVEEIIKQIEEKQDVLIEIKEKFGKIEIKDFIGKFYPEIDKNTGETRYRHTIEIPEFSAESGQVVLISGKSGRGKSTFFRLLKRGDINNRKSIKIDGKENVDKLGKQFIALKADDELGIQTNVLQQLSGKSSITDLTTEERKKLNQVIQDVSFNDEEIFEELASKNYKQFSTGQQKRLVLAKTLYRNNNNASVILVDEPVENVEEELIEEQLKIISEYARKSGAITLLSTHRIDVAEKYVDKRYHIGDDGIMREIEIKKMEEKEDLKAEDANVL